MKIKYLFTLFSSLLLIGCVNSQSIQQNEKKASNVQLPVPKKLQHNGKNYYLASQQDLGTIARYFYVEKKETLKNWKTGVELLLDRNPEQRSLADRIALRQKVYHANGVEQFNLYEKDNSLYSFVIYPPNARQNNWQVDVSKGQDFVGCGFVQYQYSLKIAKNQKLNNMSKIKLIGYLRKYVIDKEMTRLAQLQYQWRCEKDH